MSGFLTELVEDGAAFEALEAEWWALWRRCPSASPFQTPAWLIPWWRHFSPGRLFTVTVRHEGRLVGLAPFYLEDGALGRRLLPVGISLSDYHDVLLDPALAELAGAALVARVRAKGEGWDSWEFEELPPDGTALGLPCPADWREDASEQSACPVLALPVSVDALRDHIPAGKLRKLRMSRHRFARRADASLTRVEAPESDAFLHALVALHGARWASRGESGVLADARVRAFHGAALQGLVAAGLARLYALHIEGRLAGAYYGFLCRDRAYAYIGGFSPDFSFESPGTLLLGHAIEEAVAEGAREFHFLRGREAYKYEWGAVDRWTRRRSFRQGAGSDA